MTRKSTKNPKAIFYGDGPGIYLVWCNANNKGYVGKHNRAVYRLREHYELLKIGKSHNPYLQRAFDLYGEEEFTYEVIFTCCKEQTSAEEMRIIAEFGRANLFNGTDGGDGVTGHIRTDTIKEKDRLARLKGISDGRYDCLKIPVTSINIFTGIRKSYVSVNSTAIDGFLAIKVSHCINRTKKFHKGYFWVKADDSRSYDELMLTLDNTALLRAIEYLDNKPDESIIKDSTGSNDTKNRIYKALTGKLCKKVPHDAKSIERIDINTGEVKEYPSIAAASLDGVSRPCIERVLYGRCQQSRGYTWQYL